MESHDLRLPLSGALSERLLRHRTQPPALMAAVLRPVVLARLGAAARHRLTLIAAPPGSGKTVLLTQWAATLAAQPDPPRVAWLTLGAEAADPTLLTEGVEEALHQAGALQPAPLVCAADMPALEAAMLRIAAGLTSESTLLILDGAERLGPAGVALLSCLVENAPPQLHTLIATRSEPELPLPRLRLAHELLELRGDELRWDAAAAEALLNGSLQLRLSPADVRTLVAVTDGWVTGLCLAAISLRAQGGSAAAFTGADPYVVDYIAGEVLSKLPAAVQTFLLRTATLAELSVRTCAGIVPAEGHSQTAEAALSPQAMLAYLHRHNLFITPINAGRTVYRYQPLFAEALRAIALQAAPPSLPLRRGRGRGRAQRQAGRPGGAEPGGAEREHWPYDPLSPREQEILALTASGFANQEIAAQLFISQGTVKSHLKRIFGKLGARSRTEAVAIARRNGLLTTA